MTIFSTGDVDWAVDFDVLDPDYVADPSKAWSELRDRRPIARTERYGPTWLPVRYDDLAAIAQDVRRFSSRDIAVITPLRHVGPMQAVPLEAPPITSDPPIHSWARRMLLPRFGPMAIADLTPITHQVTDALVDVFAEMGRADAAVDCAQHVPVRVIARMLGVPLEDEEIFTRWTVAILQQGFQNLDTGSEAIMEVIAYVSAKLDERERVPEGEPPDDLLTVLLEAGHDGDQPTERHHIGSCLLLLLAGIDTTWSVVGSSLWHLANHHRGQAALPVRAGADALAIEGFLRFYSPVTMARYVEEDTEFNGCLMSKGDKIMMAFSAGNGDSDQFEDADALMLDREHNRHFAFGSGIHRCLGANLARMELRVALERTPFFELTDQGAVTWSGGQERAPSRSCALVG